MKLKKSWIRKIRAYETILLVFVIATIIMWKVEDPTSVQTFLSIIVLIFTIIILSKKVKGR